MHCRCRLPLFALALFLGLNVAGENELRGGTPDYLYEIPAVEGNTAESVEIAVLFDNNGASLSAWSVAVCHDTDAATLDSAEEGATTTTVNGGGAPSFSEMTVYEDGFVGGVIISFLMFNVLAPGTDYELYRATYTLEALAPTTVLLEFCDDTLPLITNRVVDTNGDAFTPEFSHGAIDITGPTPLHYQFSAGEHTVLYDNADGEASVAVSLAIQEDAADPEFPNDIEAFAMALRHPPLYISAANAAIATPLAATNGGNGPDLFLAEFLEDGTFIDVVVTAPGSGAGLFADLPVEAVVVTYETNPLAFQFNLVGVDLALEWADDLPSPAVPNRVDVSGYFVGMLAPIDGLLHFVRQRKFLRGDVTVDGSVGLADALAILTYLFSSGSIACIDTADMSDNGSLDLADPIYLLAYLFLLGDPPAFPFPDCGFDETGTPSCLQYNACP